MASHLEAGEGTGDPRAQMRMREQGDGTCGTKVGQAGQTWEGEPKEKKMPTAETHARDSLLMMWPPEKLDSPCPALEGCHRESQKRVGRKRRSGRSASHRDGGGGLTGIGICPNSHCTD